MRIAMTASVPFALSASAAKPPDVVVSDSNKIGPGLTAHLW
jgi:hypothetical protein